MSSTRIRIKTIREVSDEGDKGYRVISVTAIKRDQLPAIYLSGARPVVYFEDRPNRLPFSHGVNLTYIDGYAGVAERFYSSSDIKKINAHIKAAGQHLADVNRELAEKRKAWSGPVTFVDGREELPPRLNPGKPPTEGEGESILNRIPRLWSEGKLYYRDDKGRFRKI